MQSMLRPGRGQKNKQLLKFPVSSWRGKTNVYDIIRKIKPARIARAQAFSVVECGRKRVLMGNLGHRTNP